MSTPVNQRRALESVQMHRVLIRLAGAACLLLAASAANAEIFLSGQLALVGRNLTKNPSNKTNLGYSAFDLVSLRTFLDARITDRLAGFVQFYTGGTAYTDMMLYGAYIRYDHTPRLHLEAGLIPTPVGMWGTRIYAGENPLVGSPLMFQYKTSLAVYGPLQTEPEGILEERGEDEYSPIVYDFCWNTGIHGYASVGPFDAGLALTNGSLGSTKREMTYNRPNVAVHANWIPTPFLTVGAWGSVGPYLSLSMEPQLPPGGVVEDYNQETVGGLLHAAWSHWDVHAEVFADRHQHPYLGNLDILGGYAEVKVTLAPRWWVAGRAGHLTFSHLNDPDVDNLRWDYPISRLECGIGRHLTEKSRIKAVIQVIRYEDAPSSLNDEIVAIQFSTDL